MIKLALEMSYSGHLMKNTDLDKIPLFQNVVITAPLRIRPERGSPDVHSGLCVAAHACLHPFPSCQGNNNLWPMSRLREGSRYQIRRIFGKIPNDL